ncbi:hypothetical protein L228DRAFT_251077 [Xylona heveae TC161]|uniref:HTH myb-type domain-containing protein n=1 Tax=Xylona heveae (strain CBS 132557 / TC161) TaxID=1328760 RepID=A0A164ZT97_XYLHT|nr:hypothetical protein L228DRAFT_251077 [Xylona heveae TC161]KZF19483.1 hypothetical protein L228DRAFT_251077 [Xylona heveae TC161]
MAEAVSIDHTVTDPPVAHVGPEQNFDSLAPPEISESHDGDDTIGARLKKRRRTSSNTDDSSGKKLKQALEASGHASIPDSIPESPFEQHPAPPSHPPLPELGDPQPPLPSIEQPAVSQEVVHEPSQTDSTVDPPPDPSAQDPWEAAIAGLVDYQYRNETNAAERESDGHDVFDTNNWMSNDAIMHLRVQSLPILDNLSTQILSTLAKSSYQDILTIVTEPDSDAGHAYATLKSLFDHTKKVYSQHEPFLSAFDLSLHEQAQHDTIRKSNLATFVSSVFGSQDVGFYHLNEFFLETFVPDGGRLLKSQGALYLDLKTQAYISAMSNGERTREEILDDLFPKDLEDRLLGRRPGAKQLAPSEQDFVKRAYSRRDHLLAEPNDEEHLSALPDKYVWEDLLREVCNYVSKNFESIVTPQASRNRSSYSGTEFQPSISEEPPQYTHDQNVHTATQGYDQNNDDVVAKAANAVRVALYGTQHEGHASHTPPQEQHQPVQENRAHMLWNHDPNAAQHANAAPAMAQTLGEVPDIPYHTQTAPTQVLYERARQAATAKASPNNRRAGLPSQRRPWTTEEENALMAGLDRVKGPHWSQILAMFGPGGTVNEVLKDRNQVQLKDKARNLKLFFLKSGIEVPYYLQFVTGELKTRAPAQAAKHEARERARLKGEEDRAHIEGVMALANGSRADSTEMSPAATSIMSQPPQHHPTAQHMPQQLSQQIPQQMPQQIPQPMAQPMPQEMPQQVPQQIPQQLPQQIPQQISEQIPQQVSNPDADYERRLEQTLRAAEFTGQSEG